MRNWNGRRFIKLHRAHRTSLGLTQPPGPPSILMSKASTFIRRFMQTLYYMYIYNIYIIYNLHIRTSTYIFTHIYIHIYYIYMIMYVHSISQYMIYVSVYLAGNILGLDSGESVCMGVMSSVFSILLNIYSNSFCVGFLFKTLKSINSFRTKSYQKPPHPLFGSVSTKNQAHELPWQSFYNRFVGLVVNYSSICFGGVVLNWFSIGFKIIHYLRTVWTVVNCGFLFNCPSILCQMLSKIDLQHIYSNWKGMKHMSLLRINCLRKSI